MGRYVFRVTLKAK